MATRQCINCLTPNSWVLDADFFYNLLKSVNVTLCPLHPLEAGKIEGLSHFRGISPLGRGYGFLSLYNPTCQNSSKHQKGLSLPFCAAGKCTCHLTPHSLEGSWALRLAVSLPPCQPLKEIPASWLLPGLQSHPAVDILPLALRHTVAKLWKGWSLPGRLHKQFLNLETRRTMQIHLFSAVMFPLFHLHLSEV